MKNRAERHFSENKIENIKKQQDKRNSFIDIFNLIVSILQKLRNLEGSGFECKDEYQDKIELKPDTESVVNDLRNLKKQIDTSERNWTQSLQTLREESNYEYEFNSLFGQNFLQISEKNYQHFLKFIFGNWRGRHSFEDLENLSWKGSRQKVDNLLKLAQVDQVETLQKSEVETKRSQFYLHEYETHENVFRLILDILNNEQASISGSSYNNFYPNQVFVSTSFSSYEEILSKSTFPFNLKAFSTEFAWLLKSRTRFLFW